MECQGSTTAKLEIIQSSILPKYKDRGIAIKNYHLLWAVNDHTCYRF